MEKKYTLTFVLDESKLTRLDGTFSISNCIVERDEPAVILVTFTNEALVLASGCMSGTLPIF